MKDGAEQKTITRLGSLRFQDATCVMRFELEKEIARPRVRIFCTLTDVRLSFNVKSWEAYEHTHVLHLRFCI